MTARCSVLQLKQRVSNALSHTHRLLPQPRRSISGRVQFRSGPKRKNCPRTQRRAHDHQHRRSLQMVDPRGLADPLAQRRICGFCRTDGAGSKVSWYPMRTARSRRGPRSEISIAIRGRFIQPQRVRSCVSTLAERRSATRSSATSQLTTFCFTTLHGRAAAPICDFIA